MSRYIVTFTELRHYEMALEADDEESAIARAKTAPENPVWIAVELDRYKATPITGGAA
ncbi:hypothetical protein ACVII1_007236 [Bradyrhizobium elkanii]